MTADLARRVGDLAVVGLDHERRLEALEDALGPLRALPPEVFGALASFAQALAVAGPEEGRKIGEAMRRLQREITPVDSSVA